MESTPPDKRFERESATTGTPVTLDTRHSARLRSLHPGPLHEDRALMLSGQIIGRDATQSDLIHTGPNVSRRHAWIGQVDN
ncbi:MAG: hypothetical protein AAGJ52_11805, partial [Pseudomonadota bacterium]